MATPPPTNTDRSFRDNQRGPERRDVRLADPGQGVELREAPNGKLRFSGYASVVDQPYEIADKLGTYMETIARGAFTKTLADGADVVFNVDHGGVAMARTRAGSLRLSVDSTGLYSEAELDSSRPDVQILRSAIHNGAIDSMSFSFRATRQEWDKAYENRLITECNLNQGDVSAVGFPASPHTTGLVDVRRRQYGATGRPKPIVAPDALADAFMALQKAKVRVAKSRTWTPSGADPDWLHHAEERLRRIRRLQGRR